MELLGEVLGEKKALQALSGLSSIVAARALLDAGEALEERVIEQFLSGGAAFGAGWLPLKKQPQRHPTLIVTGALMESFHIIESDPEGITFGSEEPYAKFSEYGTAREPQRQVLTPELLGGLAEETTR